ncbi:hypothetical protein QBC43DRAFT_304682 [Cladorrhinum sp. PSN259]|nr:hypothetical protein QBC43DRAFT_304682 [Cladorrhinum sp. PSN259]
MYLPNLFKAMELEMDTPAIVGKSQHSASIARRSGETVDWGTLTPTIDDKPQGSWEEWLRPNEDLSKHDDLTNMTITEIENEGPFAIPGATVKDSWRAIVYGILILMIAGLAAKGSRIPKKLLNIKGGERNGNEVDAEQDNVEGENQAQHKPAAVPVIKHVPGLSGPTPVVAMKENNQELPMIKKSRPITGGTGGKSCCSGKENKMQKLDGRDDAKSKSNSNNSIFGDGQTRQNVRSMMVQEQR